MQSERQYLTYFEWVTPNRSFDFPRSEGRLQAFISFRAKPEPPPQSAHVKR
jgi:hypothetical protein